MRADGTYMPYDIEFQLMISTRATVALVLAWIDVWLDTIAGAVAAIDGQGGAS